MTIEKLFNTVLSFQTMSTRMAFTGSLMYAYFKKCWTDNALEKRHSVTPYQDDQTIENFSALKKNGLLPDNLFVSQKEWKTNVMRKPYLIKVDNFDNRIRALVGQACFNSFKSVCLSIVLYPSTADWNSLYHALLNASLCLTQVSHSNSLFLLKSVYFEYVLILDAILPRSTHDDLAWINNFNPVPLQNN